MKKFAAFLLCFAVSTAWIKAEGEQQEEQEYVEALLEQEEQEQENYTETEVEVTEDQEVTAPLEETEVFEPVVTEEQEPTIVTPETEDIDFTEIYVLKEEQQQDLEEILVQKSSDEDAKLEKLFQRVKNNEPQGLYKLMKHTLKNQNLEEAASECIQNPSSSTCLKTQLIAHFNLLKETKELLKKQA